MKLLQASSVALVGMALCSAVYAYQRTADFSFGDDSETNVKAEYYWSRLSYNGSVGSRKYPDLVVTRWTTRWNGADDLGSAATARR